MLEMMNSRTSDTILINSAGHTCNIPHLNILESDDNECLAHGLEMRATCCDGSGVELVREVRRDLHLGNRPVLSVLAKSNVGRIARSRPSSCQELNSVTKSGHTRKNVADWSHSTAPEWGSNPTSLGFTYHRRWIKFQRIMKTKRRIRNRRL